MDTFAETIFTSNPSFQLPRGVFIHHPEEDSAREHNIYKMDQEFLELMDNVAYTTKIHSLFKAEETGMQPYYVLHSGLPAAGMGCWKQLSLHLL
jgi:hypothetical protein